MVAIGAHWDEVFRFSGEARSGQSHPATVDGRAGGCGFNTAAALAAHGRTVAHAGLRGADPLGARLAAALDAAGLRDVGLVLPDEATGRYVAFVEPDGTLAMAAASMSIYDHASALAASDTYLEAARSADWLILDANAPPAATRALAGTRRPGAALALLATSSSKAPSLVPLLGEAELLFANEGEWEVLSGTGEAAPTLAFVTNGAQGATIFRKGEAIRQLPSSAGQVVDVIGAGDAFAAGTFHALLDGAEPERAMETGMDWAARCLGEPTALGWLVDHAGGVHESEGADEHEG